MACSARARGEPKRHRAFAVDCKLQMAVRHVQAISAVNSRPKLASHTGYDIPPYAFAVVRSHNKNARMPNPKVPNP